MVINEPIYKELIYKIEMESEMQKTNVWLPRGKRWGGKNWEIWIDIYTLIYTKQIINNDLLYSTGNFTQYSVIAYMGKESIKEWL